FVMSADELYGPITTLKKDGKTVKRIPWSAFKIKESDWSRINDIIAILKDANSIQQLFSAEKVPTLWRALPAIENLLTAWEDKYEDPVYSLYAPGLEMAIDKIRKYYTKFDDKPAYILSIVLHPYFKLAYFKTAWGGEKEYQDALSNGDQDAKNWQDEARKVVEQTVR
ncbi:hypothetical protein BV25DRAFT_1777287, partial [Artomyces pyxidatus]